ncbi:undecaprenyl-diphosphate phosphatase [archaeon]|nr:MAG: undecaprenyl-diphosphate phosphatase [archaeon]
MELFELILIGALQGVFEWLPVSSEGIVSIVSTQLIGEDVLTSVHMAIWLHLGTMLAATLYLREDVASLVRQVPSYMSGLPHARPFSERDSALLSFIIIATLFTGIVGGFLYLFGIRMLAGSPRLFTFIMGLALIITGALRTYGPARERFADDTTLADSVFVGILQGLSVIPGISRSGSTVFGLLYRRFDAKEAFRLSFLLSIPAVLAANIGIELTSGIEVDAGMLVAMCVSFIVGYVTIDIVLRFAAHVRVSLVCFILAAMLFASLAL